MQRFTSPGFDHRLGVGHGLIDSRGCPSPLASSPVRHRTVSPRVGRYALLCTLASALACKVHAQTLPPATSDAKPAQAAHCLPGNDGYLRARLRGAIEVELDWRNQDTECTGAVRPTDGGIRMRFTHAGAGKDQQLVLVFGVAKLNEGQSARNVPVNVTLIREGAGEFYGTQGDDKCMFDEVRQTPLKGIPLRERSYRVVVRGYCTEPARALTGDGAVLISRFDFAGRIDFETEDAASPDSKPAAAAVQTKATEQ